MLLFFFQTFCFCFLGIRQNEDVNGNGVGVANRDGAAATDHENGEQIPMQIIDENV